MSRTAHVESESLLLLLPLMAALALLAERAWRIGDNIQVRGTCSLLSRVQQQRINVLCVTARVRHQHDRARHRGVWRAARSPEAALFRLEVLHVV
jgi:hypothetical protein